MLVEQIVRHFDASGAQIGPAETITYSKLYDVYGATRSLSGSPTSRQGFVGSLGHESDDETGLIYMRARYYDPLTGRFASEDPARDGMNWFSYSDNNPVNKIDASGKDPDALVVAFFGGVIGFIAGFSSSVESDYLNGNAINWGNAFAQGGIWGAAGLAVGCFGGGGAGLPALAAVGQLALYSLAAVAAMVILGTVAAATASYVGEMAGALIQDIDDGAKQESSDDDRTNLY